MPVLSVDDVTVTEGEDATADFTVRLAPAATATVTVDYATEDGLAREPGDYTSTSGTLTFNAGETEKTVSVPIIDDAEEDDGETFVLRLSNPSGGNAVLAQRTGATAIIRNDESGTPALTPLTAEFSGAPAGHGGQPFTVELAFSEEFPLSYKLLQGADGQASVIAVAGGAVTRAARVAAGESRRWTVTVAPGGSDDVTLTLPATTDCEAEGAICTEDDRPLAAAVAATVPNAAPVVDTPFTVRLAGLPAAHDGESAVSFEVHFSEEPHQYSFRTLRDETLDIRQGGTRLAPYVKRKNKPSNRAWTVTVEPGSKADLAVAIAATADCAAPGAVCNEDGEPLSNAVSATVLGPPGISVADATVTEAAGATMDFSVTMSRASSATVTVDYATSDGTATAGADYTAASGTLSFAPGETAKTVSVPVLDDAHDDDGETFTLTLSNPSGGNAYLADSEAVGTIENADAMPTAWLARFGRTVAEQAIDAVETRLAAARAPGVEMNLAGERIGGSPDAGRQDKRQAAMADWLRGVETGARSRAVTPREIATGSSFALTGEAGDGGTVALWGRGAASRFDGRDGDLEIDGEVASAMLGADWSGGRLTAGVMLSRSLGEGGYRAAEASGTVESTLTGLFPYGSYAVNDRVTLWGIAGYGAGTLTLTPEGQAAMRTDMDLAMGAVGVRGVAIQAGPEGGMELAVKTDAMALRATSEKTEGLVSAEAEVNRLRLALEGTWRGLMLGGGTLAPGFEVGLRHDGGDAETGFGVDLGGGLAWSDPASGLSAEIRGRGLLTHDSRGFRDRGLSGAFGWAPGEAGKGPSVTLTQTLGAPSSGGADALLGRRHLGGLAPDDGAPTDRRLELRAGYGFTVLDDRFAMTPELGLGLGNGQREYTLGWRLGLAQGGTAALDASLEAARRETANDNGAAEHAAGFRVTARW